MKLYAFLKKGQRFVFTIALFILVFVTAGFVKVQAASMIIGWLWGGSEDASIGGTTGTIDGNETGLGWISMSSTNPGAGGSVSYGVRIGDDGKLSGYGWSENIGWISFNESDLVDCPSGTCSARREGNYLRGWARIMSIPQAGANAGGWQGWISLSGANYGVEISKMDGTGNNPTYAWSDELGWIDFSRARIEEVCSLEFVPSSKTMNENSTSSDEVTIGEVGSSCNCGPVTLSSSNESVVSVTPASVDFSSPTVQSAGITLQAGSVSSTNNYNDIVTASSAICGTANLDLTVINVPVCNISCPESYTVVPDGAWHSYSCEVSGETGCKVDSCSKTSGSSKVEVQTGSALNTCEVKADPSARYDTAVSRATAGTGSDDTDINVRPLGWIETNP